MTLCLRSMRGSRSSGVGRPSGAADIQNSPHHVARRPRGCGKEGFAAVCAADGRVRSACSTPPSVPWSCTMDTSSAAWDTGAANSPWRASNLLQAILAAPVATCAAHLEDRA